MNSTFQRPVDFERAKRFVHAARTDLEISICTPEVQHDLLTYGTMSHWTCKDQHATRVRSTGAERHVP